VKTMNLRAASILEHHLSRVQRERDPSCRGITAKVRVQLLKFVAEIAASYDESTKFHNYEHAIHVLTSMNKLLSLSLDETPLNSFSLTLSAFIHDAGHTGMSNQMLHSTRHHLSQKYQEDVPIAEFNSIELGLEKLFEPEFSSLRLAIIPEEMEKIKFVRTLFQSILATDIAKPSNVQLGIRRHDVTQKGDEAPADLCPLASYLSNVVRLTHLDDNVTEERPEEFAVTALGLKDCVRNEHLMMLSDVGHCLQGWPNFMKFNFRLYCELHACWKMGLCDHPSGGWYQSQIGFFEAYVLPLAERSRAYLDRDSGDGVLANGRTNLDRWIVLGRRATEIMAEAAEGNDKERNVLLKLYELTDSGEYV